MYYAIRWTYGRACDSRTGDRIGNYYAFDTRRERDKWCDDGPYYTSNPGFREAIKASDPELRRIKRYDTLRILGDGMMVV